jgi:transcriptional regulator with XRE-family HTH domain
VPFGKINKQNGRPRHPLSFIREKENLDQGELSNIIGTSVNMISRVENGQSQLPIEKLYDLIEAYDIDIEEYKKEDKDFRYKMCDYLLSLD